MRRVWVEKAIRIEREYYFSITFDRGAKSALFMLTTEGGMDIEAVAVGTTRGSSRGMHLDPRVGYQPWFARQLSFAAGDPEGRAQAASAP